MLHRVHVCSEAKLCVRHERGCMPISVRLRAEAVLLVTQAAYALDAREVGGSSAPMHDHDHLRRGVNLTERH